MNRTKKRNQELAKELHRTQVLLKAEREVNLGLQMILARLVPELDVCRHGDDTPFCLDCFPPAPEAVVLPLLKGVNL